MSNKHTNILNYNKILKNIYFFNVINLIIYYYVITV